MTFVLDNSVTLSWCFEDERTDETKALLERVGETGALAPQHWPLEILNGLMMAERSGRIDATTRQGLADFLRDLPVTIDPDTALQVWDPTRRLAERFRLTVYDAVNLELARRRNLPSPRSIRISEVPRRPSVCRCSDSKRDNTARFESWVAQYSTCSTATTSGT